MSDALARCDRVLALFSRAYFERPRYTDEWTVALVHVPGTEQGRLVPVRVENMPGKDMPTVLRPLIFCDSDTRAAYDAESRSSWSTSWRRLLRLRYPIARKTGLLPGQARVVHAV